MSRRRRFLALLAAFLALAAALPFAAKTLLWRWESNPVLRGRLLAERQGCDSCHRPFGAQEIENPGSRWGTVPAFQSGNSMMYVRDQAEVEEMIRLGAPGSWLEAPEARRRLESQRLRMPAYGGRLSEHQIGDLVALVRAEEPFGLAEDPQASQGRALARRLGCPSCHGPEGAGGRPNPGSLGGFIPGFLGKNFDHLVTGRKEYFEWVRTGTSKRLQANPLVRFFWRRQAISMPAYGDALSDEELESLWAWTRCARRTFSRSPPESERAKP